MAISSSHVWSDLPISPGSVLADELAARDMTQKELAARTGRPPQAINEIIRGKKAITHSSAMELQKALGVPAQFWVNLEIAYRMTIERLEERKRVEVEIDALKRFPVALMQKRGWIPGFSSRADKVSAIQEYLSIASLNNVQETLTAAFRITGGGTHSPEALAVWLKQGEIQGSRIETAPFNSQRFKATLSAVRGLTTQQPEVFMPKLTDWCSDAGVAFVVVEELPKSGANGSTKWLSPDKVLIQLSLKWKWADVFWFTFFHEAHHVLERRKGNYIDGIADTVKNAREERVADEFSADLLIPRDQWDQFRGSGCFSASCVKGFASGIGIDAGIVVGRLQHEHLIPYSRLTNLKSRFEWTQ